MSNNYLLCSNTKLLDSAIELCAFTGQLTLVNQLTQITSEYYLELDDDGLKLCSSKFTPLLVSQTYQELGKQVQSGGKCLLNQALKIKRRSNKQLRVLDVMAGLGRDAALLSLNQFQVTMVEQNPILATFLHYAVTHGYISGNVAVVYMNSMDYLACLSNDVFDIAYLDPMFNHTKKARAKKAMQLVQMVTALDNNSHFASQQVFHLARQKIAKLVVKRDDRQPSLVTTPPPSFTKQGKTVRYDVYYF